MKGRQAQQDCCAHTLTVAEAVCKTKIAQRGKESSHLTEELTDGFWGKEHHSL